LTLYRLSANTRRKSYRNLVSNLETVDLSQIKRRAVSGVVVLFLREILTGLIFIVANIFLARLLSPGAFGVFATLQLMMYIFTAFSETGFAGALIRQPTAPTSRQLDTVFTIQQTVVLILAGFILIWAEALAVLFRISDASGTTGQEAAWLVRLLAVCFIVSSLQTIPAALLERDLRFLNLAIIDVVEAVVFYGGAVLIALFSANTWSLVLALLARNIIGTILTYFAHFWKPSRLFSFDWATMKQLWSFGVPFQVLLFGSLFKDTITVMASGAVLGVEAVAYLFFAYNLAIIPARISNLATRVSFPTLARLRDHPAAVRQTVENVLKVSFWTAGTISLATMALIPAIVSFVYDPKWLVANVAVWCYVVCALLDYLIMPLVTAVSALGRPWWTAIVVALWSIFNFALGFSLIGWLGFNAIAVAASVTTTVTAIGVIIYTRRVIGWRLRPVLQNWLIAAMPVTLGLWLVSPFVTNFFILLIVLVVGAIIYLGLLYALEGKMVYRLFKELSGNKKVPLNSDVLGEEKL
jgi:O-antigen/teichoic acid export membrane protein